jgi:hypothetical protein
MPYGLHPSRSKFSDTHYRNGGYFSRQQNSRLSRPHRLITSHRHLSTSKGWRTICSPGRVLALLVSCIAVMYLAANYSVFAPVRQLRTNPPVSTLQPVRGIAEGAVASLKDEHFPQEKGRRESPFLRDEHALQRKIEGESSQGDSTRLRKSNAHLVTNWCQKSSTRRTTVLRRTIPY